jgi:hypothetical protein
MIKKLLAKYFSFLWRSPDKKILSVPKDYDLSILDNNYICQLNFKLLPNEEIDIEFLHLDTESMGVEDILVISEKYARLIVMINNGLLKKQFLNTLKSYQKEQADNDKNVLLFDNIMFFNNLLQKELKLIQKENEPLVRPSSVFRSA